MKDIECLLFNKPAIRRNKREGEEGIYGKRKKNDLDWQDQRQPVPADFELHHAAVAG